MVKSVLGKEVSQQLGNIHGGWQLVKIFPFSAWRRNSRWHHISLKKRKEGRKRGKGGKGDACLPAWKLTIQGKKEEAVSFPPPKKSHPHLTTNWNFEPGDATRVSLILDERGKKERKSWQEKHLTFPINYVHATGSVFFGGKETRRSSQTWEKQKKKNAGNPRLPPQKKFWINWSSLD